MLVLSSYQTASAKWFFGREKKQQIASRDTTVADDTGRDTMAAQAPVLDTGKYQKGNVVQKVRGKNTVEKDVDNGITDMMMMPIKPLNVMAPLKDTKEGLERVSGSINELHDPLNNLSAPINGVHRSVDNLTPSINQLKHPLDGIEKGTTGLQAPIANVGVSVGALNKPISALNKPITDLHDPIQKLRDPITGLQRPIENVAKPISQLEKPISDLEKPISDLQGPLQQIGEPIKRLSDPLAQVSDSITGLKTEVVGLKEQLRDITVIIERIVFYVLCTVALLAAIAIIFLLSLTLVLTNKSLRTKVVEKFRIVHKD